MEDWSLCSGFIFGYAFCVTERVILDGNRGKEIQDTRESLAEPQLAVSSASWSLPRRQPQPEGWDGVIEWCCREAQPLGTGGSSHEHPKEQILLKVQGRKAVCDLV